MEIKMDQDALASIASAAIFDHLSEDARADIIKQAIQFLLTPDKNRNAYGPTKTPLQISFDNAIASVAQKVVREKIENDPEILAEIEKLIGPLLNAALNAEAEEYNYGLADALGAALGQWLGEQARNRSSR